MCASRSRLCNVCAIAQIEWAHMVKAELILLGRWLLGVGLPRVLAGGTAFLLVVALGLVGLYEHRHISADLRESLLVALAPDAPDSALTTSLRQAQSHVRTWRDRQECIKLQQAVETMNTAQRNEMVLDERLKLAQTQLDAEIHSERLMIVTERAYLNSHQAMPVGLANDVAGEQQRRERVRDQRRRDDDGAWLQVLQQRLDARVMLQELRVDLGLARPVPQP